VPIEDQGYFFASIVLPDGATLGRTAKVGAGVQKVLAENPAVDHVFVINGFDLIGGGNKTNAATVFITLKPWETRSATSDDLIKHVFMKGAAFREGLVLAFNPPPIRGLGSSGGFEVFVQNRADGDPVRLAEVIQQFTAELKKRPELSGVNTFYRPTIPQLFVEVDREKALSLGVPVGDLFDALQGMLGALYVNDFNKSGRTYRVQIQAENTYRSRPEDLGSIYVRSATTGSMIQVASIIALCLEGS